jgi:hypothetical protein
MVYINLEMGRHIMVNGKIAKCMDMVNFYGMKEKNFMDFIRMIKRMVLEYIIGLIINFI